MRPNLDWRAVLSGGALSIAYLCAAAMPSAASSDSQGTTPTPTASKVGVTARHLNVRAGSRAVVRGVIRPAGSTVALQVRRRGHWATLDRDRTDASGRYVLRNRMGSPMSARARVRVSRGPAGKHGLGRLNVYRYALASWYGPGLYGNRLGCGGRLGTSQLGVAHKSLPCGTRVTLRHRGRVVRVPVIDRGPYVGAREYDLTAATARRLKFKGHGSILSTR